MENYCKSESPLPTFILRKKYIEILGLTRKEAMIYCRFDRRHKVAERLEQLGGEIIDFQFEEQGVQTWRMPK